MNYSVLNFDLGIFNSKLKIEQFLMRIAHNSKLKTQNSKLKIEQFKIANGDNSKLKIQNSKLKICEILKTLK